eukprot:CAMPEP_0119341878 /NCGR_PEP_ID=MMETSP1333-20130426/103531_1 /TAXON_ID=418940 /ORGANISM="Scyphosphaera apsteinii, Strain RCC1455" /LENGTH=340 /DNA_ID=CAMNT_0007353967 /DNA_START=19 /DNA_END=1041 /DNA_ORIENTATION=+
MDAPHEAEEAAVSVFRKPKRNKNVRQRPGADGRAPVADEAGPSVVRITKVAKANPMVQGTSGAKKSGTLQSEFAHSSDRRISAYDNKVTASNEQETERDRDAQAQFEEAQQQLADGGDIAADGTKVYRGSKAYHQYTGTAENFDSKMLQGCGPARAPVHYRAVSRIDYQPDVCKDFKDTGYCGYGDACKFLHDRSDYKTGWQLEKDWEERQRAKKHEEALEALGESEAKPKAEDDSLPFACLNCREPWDKRSNPVVTKCGHYFCERCALGHFKTSRRCFACGEQTAGIFNQAKAIIEKINMRAQVDEADDDMSDEQMLAEYDAAKKQQGARSYTGGWALR